MLGRGKTAISNEVSRIEVTGTYNAQKASTKSQARRKASKFQAKKIVSHADLQQFVDTALLQRQSPGAITGRLKAGLEPGLPPASRDTIETYIRSVHGRRIEYRLKVLKANQKHRGRNKRPGIVMHGDPKKSVDDRLADITNRDQVGDLEVDFIVSGNTGSGYALTAADC